MKKSSLYLEDGTCYPGYSFGAEKSVFGEVVFNTGLVGYNETLTDPSYKGQILVFTYPLIGNYGVPGERKEHNLSYFFESDKIHVSGVIVSRCSSSNHWNSVKSLSQWLQEHHIPALQGIDTRALTKRLRSKGTMLGKIVWEKEPDFYDPNKDNLVKKVSISHPRVYNSQGKIKVIVVDCGVKNNIIRSLVRRNCCVIRVPWDYNFFDYSFDGVLISNGPGDPKRCPQTVSLIRKCLDKEIPTFGVCLGHQILALAAGANTYKLKYGHRSQNQPCLQVGTRRCFITSQNHGYAVETGSLPSDWIPWFVNINDNTNEGIKHKCKPFLSLQFHPEHSPGPVDTEFLFDAFLELTGK